MLACRLRFHFEALALAEVTAPAAYFLAPLLSSSAQSCYSLSLHSSIMSSAHGCDPSALPNEQPPTDDSSPTSGLSGSTLNNSPPPEQAKIDSILLHAAEELSLEMSERHDEREHLSPFVYYDDLSFEESGDEMALIRAAEQEGKGSRKEERPMSPTVYYETSDAPPGVSGSEDLQLAATD